MAINVPKAGGASVGIKSGGKVKAGQIAFDPDKWLVTLFRTLKQFLSNKIDLDIYDLRFDFPSAVDLGDYMPLDKTVIHFVYDDFNHPTFGFGDNVIDETVDASAGTITEFEVREHIINLDVGIWASAKSGGVTARLEAYQLLSNLFVGAVAFERLRDQTGIEIRSFNGGTFIKEDIGGIDVFRAMGMTLVLRVYSRVTRDSKPYALDAQLDPQLTTEDNIILST